MSEEKKDRNEKMLDLYVNDGLMLREIGEIYGISRERVRQVISKDPLYGVARDLRVKRNKFEGGLHKLIGTQKKKYKTKEKFWNNIDRSDNGCWIWIGYNHPVSGYPIFSSEVMRKDYGEARYAHRIMWCMYNDRKIADGMYIKHSCGNKKCVNPEHLYLSESPR